MVAAAVERWGRVDILVTNAAALFAGQRGGDHGEDDWNRLINTNLTRVWRGMK